MTQMIRKQIYIPKRQQLLLKRRAKARGVSEAELVRQAIDRDLEGGMPHFFRRDPEAWEKACKFMLARQAETTGTKQPYHWQRADAYEERLHRYGRKTK